MSHLPRRTTGQLLGLLLLALLSLGLSACGSSDKPDVPAGATAIVYSARSNTVTVDAAKTPYLTQVSGEAASRLDAVTVVSTEGQPVVTTTLQLRNDGQNGASRDKQDLLNRQTVLTRTASSAAATGEANQLQAIALAADAIRRATGPKLLVVIDDGLQTVAPLRFQDGLLQPGSDPAQLAAFVQSVGSVPDLTGITVVWMGMGQTRAPQDPLHLPARDKARAIWSAVLSLGNPASLDFVDDGLLTMDTPPALPTVTVVPVPALDSYTPPATTPQQPAPTPITAPFEADQLGFRPDSAEFVDADRAEQILSVTAQQLLVGGYCDIRVLGTSADVGDLPGQIELSARRASAVRDLIAKAGIPDRCFTSVTGVGSQFDGFVPDHNPDGSLNEPAAALNRLVLVTATD